ncbi:hypothetical protein BO221_34600 [Archangium sp. Cb G35]|uniref:hypothetical protein n=1 Tax=Archangium sp. Cb G35 TaxID=1920190 RepID=UPI000935945E|nr:hypothetical protein [Archangium sp. Cb G35]OJT19511.1 hypothetical protein BO221_34600 [Archangium sp. Cb G35]
MRRGYIPLLLWVLVGGTACPHAFGKGGTIDRAVLKDMEESVRRPKPRDCGPATLQAICLPEKLAECERQCWEALAAQEEEDEW